MKKSLLSQAIVAALFAMAGLRNAYTQDTAFNYRMGVGFPGDVNRDHPASITPGLCNSSVQAPRLYGDAVLVDTATNSYRGLVAGDTAVTVIDGIAVRPYPTQQTSGGMTSTFGTAPVNTGQPVDVLEDGYAIVKIPAGQTTTKKGAVYIWVTASSGAHVQGGFETVTSSGNTAGPITNAVFNGPPDANGVTEIRLRALL